MKNKLSKSAFILLLITSICELFLIIQAKKKYDNKEKFIRKVCSNYDTVYQWLNLKDRKGKVSDYCEEKGIKTVAIYGMGDLGNLLYNELTENSIEVKYAIDINAKMLDSKIEVVQPSEVIEMEAVDCVIVSAVFAFDTIVVTLQDKLNCPIISLMECLVEA